MALHITYFVHGTTTDNERGFATGWAPGELSEVGKAQAVRIGELVAGQSFDAFFCSDLKRAVDSAALGFGTKYRIISDWRLRECNYGDFTQRPESEFKDRMEDHVTTPFPHGESYTDVERRVADLLRMLDKDWSGKRIALLAHQAPQLALEVIVHGKTWPRAIAEDWRKAKAWQPGWEYVVE